MRIKLFVSHVRQRGSITPALLSAGSTWHARPLAASVCTVVPAIRYNNLRKLKRS